jgi:hypothetical protein
MRLKRWSVIVAIIALLATVAGVSLEGAWAQGEPELQTSGGVGDVKLLAKGVGLSVPLQITCSGASQVTYFEMSVEIRQRVSKSATAVTGASTYIFDSDVTVPVCNGQPQTVALRTAISQGTPFKKGVALVSGSVYLCGIVDTSGEYPTQECRSSSISQEIRIK